MQPWILDHDKGTAFDQVKPPIYSVYAIDAHRLGVHHLAREIRKHEQQEIDASNVPEGGALYPDFAHWYPVTYCSFNWFAISLTNYLRLVALVELVIRNAWTEGHLVANAGEVKTHCNSFVLEVIPSIQKWRDKVAAHPAATAPQTETGRRPADVLPTLLQSYAHSVSTAAGYFVIGAEKMVIDAKRDVLAPWSPTETFERLKPRFWPDLSIEPHQFPEGRAPTDAPDTYLRWVRNLP